MIPKIRNCYLCLKEIDFSFDELHYLGTVYICQVFNTFNLLSVRITFTHDWIIVEHTTSLLITI